VTCALFLMRQCQSSNPSTPARAVNVPHRILVAVPDPCSPCVAPSRSACTFMPRGSPRAKWSGPVRVAAHEPLRYKGCDGSLLSPILPFSHSPSSSGPAPRAVRALYAAVRRRARALRRTSAGARSGACLPLFIQISRCRLLPRHWNAARLPRLLLRSPPPLSTTSSSESLGPSTPRISAAALWLVLLT
jgi:hypothetical protein